MTKRDSELGPVYWWGVVCSASAWLLVIVGRVRTTNDTPAGWAVGLLMLLLLAGTSWGGVGFLIGVITIHLLELA